MAEIDAARVVAALREQLSEANLQVALNKAAAEQNRAVAEALSAKYETQDAEQLADLASEFLSKSKAAKGQVEGPGDEK